MPSPKRIVIGISGASGIIYGVRLLEMLSDMPDVETHLVLSDAGALTAAYELDQTPNDIKGLADVVHAPKNIGASIASGSFRAFGMIVAPCSMKTMSEIAYSNTSSLLTRAADVMLKEQRKLVLMIRETPLHLGHLRTLTQLAEMGAVIAPPVPAFYARPETLDDMVNHSVGRVLDQFDIDTGKVTRWKADQ